jgi:hypothetical protein
MGWPGSSVAPERHGRVDLYPPAATHPSPAIVFVHGGPIPADLRPTLVTGRCTGDMAPLPPCVALPASRLITGSTTPATTHSPPVMSPRRSKPRGPILASMPIG